MPELIEPNRSVEQNRLLWARLTDLSRQKQWPVDGELQYLTKDEWKIIMTSGLKREQRIAKGMHGGFVMLGYPTSRMRVSEMNDLLTLMQMWGDEHGIIWTDLPPILQDDDKKING